MFPIGDDREVGGSAALVVMGLVALNVVAFLFELAQPSQGALQSFIQAWGVVPHEYVVRHDLPPTIPVPFWSTLVTSMFLHAGWAHLGGNMLYLWIFGNNIEDLLGRARFLLLYLAGGVAAALIQALSAAHSQVPMIGASGAVAGVLGAYLVTYPRANVHVFLWIIIFFWIVTIPAWILLGFWFAMQVFSGLATERGEPGVAFWAHVGGCIAGILLY